MLYQMQHSLRTDLMKTEQGADFNFPLHLHDSFEMITVTEGEMTVTVDGHSYTLSKGHFLLIFPNQLHSLATERSSRHFLCIFSPGLVKLYAKQCLSRLPESNLFTLDAFYLDKLMSLTADDEEDLIAVKGLLYSVCGAFHKQAVYTAGKAATEQLLARIFRFVEENYKGDCSLGALSAHMSYDYTYLSRYFKQYTGISFLDYVNRCRVDEACYLLQNSDRSVLQTAYECGFESLRSFNRNFRRVTGVTPCAYRKSGGAVTDK